MQQPYILDRNNPIGVFDSGVGGLTVLSALAKILPKEDFIYLGDTARVPYGGRSAHIIQRYSLEIVDFLVKKKIKLLVIACNTSTAFAENLIKEKYPYLPVVGVIQPGVDALIKKLSSNKAGVVGTVSTIKSGEYTKRLHQINPNLEVLAQACPILVPLVEEAWLDNEVSELVIRKYFEVFLSKGINTVVLGCTHYPLLKKTIQKIFPSLQLIDSSEESASHVFALLNTQGLNRNISERQGRHDRIQLFFTDKSNPQIHIEKFLNGVSVDEISEVSLQAP